MQVLTVCESAQTYLFFQTCVTVSRHSFLIIFLSSNSENNFCLTTHLTILHRSMTMQMFPLESMTSALRKNWTVLVSIGSFLLFMSLNSCIFGCRMLAVKLNFSWNDKNKTKTRSFFFFRFLVHIYNFYFFISIFFLVIMFELIYSIFLLLFISIYKKLRFLHHNFISFFA